MEEFFLKLGLMTQRNHAELIKELRELKLAVDNLTAKIQIISDKSSANHAAIQNSLDGVADKISALNDTSNTNHMTIQNSLDGMTDKISALNDTSNTNHMTIQNSVEVLAKNIYQLTNKMVADNRDEKEILTAMEELLRLTAANQMMNLIGK